MFARLKGKLIELSTNKILQNRQAGWVYFFIILKRKKRKRKEINRNKFLHTIWLLILFEMRLKWKIAIFFCDFRAFFRFCIIFCFVCNDSGRVGYLCRVFGLFSFFFFSTVLFYFFFLTLCCCYWIILMGYLLDYFGIFICGICNNMEMLIYVIYVIYVIMWNFGKYWWWINNNK